MEMHSSDLVTVGMFASRHDAEVSRARLEAEGIAGWVRADDAGGYEPQLGLTNGVQLVVRAPFMALAMDVLEPIPPGRNHQSPPWVFLVAALLSTVLLLIVGMPLVLTLWRLLSG